MIISTKGRYALRVMVDLAQHNNGEFVPLKEITERQDISRKYLETIMTILSKSNLVESAMGKAGGYRLIKEPKDYSVGEILRATERNLAPVACVCTEEKKCEKTDLCNTLPFWEGLANQINLYIDSHTLEEMVNTHINQSEECACKNKLLKENESNGN